MAFWYVREAAAREIEDRWVVKRRRLEPNSLTVESVVAVALYVGQRRGNRHDTLKDAPGYICHRYFANQLTNCYNRTMCENTTAFVSRKVVSSRMLSDLTSFQKSVIEFEAFGRREYKLEPVLRQPRSF